jgi:hypothetical protein
MQRGGLKTGVVIEKVQVLIQKAHTVKIRFKIEQPNNRVEIQAWAFRA